MPSIRLKAFEQATSQTIVIGRLDQPGSDVAGDTGDVDAAQVGEAGRERLTQQLLPGIQSDEIVQQARRAKIDRTRRQQLQRQRKVDASPRRSAARAAAGRPPRRRTTTIATPPVRGTCDARGASASAPRVIDQAVPPRPRP